MSKFKFDKKQLPQIIVLGVLTLCMFGYFISKLIVAPPTQAAAVAAPTTAATSGTVTPAEGNTTAAAQDTPAPAALIGAAAPTDTMHDPFVADATPPVVLATPPAVAAVPQKGAPSAVPNVPTLPSLGDVQPLSTSAAATGAATAGWTVTGIIASDADPSAAVAIFRTGEERRYVRLGNMLDDTSRLVGIDRDGVTIMRHGDRIRLPLGGDPATKTSAAPAAPNGALSVQSGSAAATEPLTAEPAPATQSSISLPAWVHAGK